MNNPIIQQLFVDLQAIGQGALTTLMVVLGMLLVVEVIRNFKSWDK